jgi:hypothetical protein
LRANRPTPFGELNTLRLVTGRYTRETRRIFPAYWTAGVLSKLPIRTRGEVLPACPHIGSMPGKRLGVCDVKDVFARK